MLLNRSQGFGVGPTVNPHTKVRIELCLGSLGMGKTDYRIHSGRRINFSTSRWFWGIGSFEL